jgi:adenine-specific DNA methylase
VIATELNPVACVIEKATIEFPSKFGTDLAKDIDRWGNVIAKQIEESLEGCFPRRPGEADLCYIWVRTAFCPDCHLIVPLSPNWRLDNANGIGYEPVTPSTMESKEGV